MAWALAATVPYRGVSYRLPLPIGGVCTSVRGRHRGGARPASAAPGYRLRTGARIRSARHIGRSRLTGFATTEDPKHAVERLRPSAPVVPDHGAARVVHQVAQDQSGNDRVVK